ncbi:MAG TPA: hypothetical protein VEA99_00615 [Gemmatimonadaceae bacterium]|nr:hypothetical protein [Gemmatimonadaceae bacterium]
MTELLKKAFEAAAQLPEEEQKALAVAILAEVASDDDWDARFSGSAETLADLADEALAEYRRGETKPLDPDAL